MNLLPSLTQLAGHGLDNIIYRREIGVTMLGKVRRKSPLLTVNLRMSIVVALCLAAFSTFGFTGLAATSGGFLALFTLTAFPVAFRHAFRSLYRERLAGTLEQLCLTAIPAPELFEGKFYGSLEPFFQARRHLFILSGLLCFAAYQLGAGPMTPMVAAACLIALNHYGYSAQLGTLCGLRTGAGRSKWVPDMLKEMDLNPWTNHLMFLASSGLIYLILAYMLIVFFAGQWFSLGPFPTLFGCALTLLVPIGAAYRMANHERAERERVQRIFRRYLQFERIV